MAVIIKYKTTNGSYINDSSWTLGSASIVGASHTPDSNGYFSVGLNVDNVPNYFARHNEKITSVVITNDSAPSSGYIIGDGAFYGCDFLNSVKITGNCVEICYECFRHCEQLVSVELPDSIKKIDDYAFYCCYQLKQITLPENLQELGSFAFQECSSLTEIHIPNKDCILQNDCFSRCYGLSSATQTDDFNLTYEAVFRGCKNLKTIKLREGMKILPNRTFEQCCNGEDGIEEIVLPSSLESIGEKCFYDCKKLNKITFKSIIAPTFVNDGENSTFYGVKENGTFYHLEGSDYSSYLDNSGVTLGTLGWNGVPTNFPDTPDEPSNEFNITIPTTVVKSMYNEGVIRVETLFPIEEESIIDIRCNEDNVDVYFPTDAEITDDGRYIGVGDIYVNNNFTGTLITLTVYYGVGIADTVVGNYTISVISENGEPYLEVTPNTFSISQNGTDLTVKVKYYNTDVNTIPTPTTNTTDVEINYNDVEDVYLMSSSKVIGVERTYYLYVGKTTYKRIIIVNFSCLGFDGSTSETTSLYINQDGEDNPNTPDDTNDVHAIWEDFEITFTDDAEFSLYNNGKEFYTGHVYPRPNKTISSVYLNKIMQDYVYMRPLDEVLSGANIQYHPEGLMNVEVKRNGSNATNSYVFQYDYSYKNENPLIVSNLIVPYYVRGQKILLTLRNSSFNAKSVQYKLGNVTNTINILPMEYKTISINTEDFESITINGVEIDIVDSCKVRYVLYYLNSKGGWTSFPIEGRVNSRDNLTSYEITRNFNNTRPDFGTMRYLSQYSTSYDFNTGWLTEAQSELMPELLESNLVYVHDLRENKIIPLTLNNDVVEHKRKSLNEKLISYTITAKTAQTKIRL